MNGCWVFQETAYLLTYLGIVVVEGNTKLVISWNIQSNKCLIIPMQTLDVNKCLVIYEYYSIHTATLTTEPFLSESLNANKRWDCGRLCACMSSVHDWWECGGECTSLSSVLTCLVIYNHAVHCIHTATVTTGRTFMYVLCYNHYYVEYQIYDISSAYISSAYPNVYTIVRNKPYLLWHYR
jgi:hypothetical protein